MIDNSSSSILSTERKGAYAHQWQLGAGKTMLIECTGLDYDPQISEKAFAFIHVREGDTFRCFVANKQQLQQCFDRINNNRSEADPEIINWVAGHVADLKEVSRRLEEGESLSATEDRKDVKFDKELKPTTPEEEDSLQTEQEQTLRIDKTMANLVQEALELPNFCSKVNAKELFFEEFQELKHKVFGAIRRPVTSRLYGCFNLGGLLPVQSKSYYYRDMDFIDPKPGAKLVVYSYNTNIVYDRKLLIRKITKSTKMNIGLGFTLTPGTAPIVVKEGDKAYKKGQPIMKGGNQQARLDFGMVKKHYELRIRAESRFSLIHELVRKDVIDLR